jgi:HK97 family phage major capsid protein
MIRKHLSILRDTDPGQAATGSAGAPSASTLQPFNASTIGEAADPVARATTQIGEIATSVKELRRQQQDMQKHLDDLRRRGLRVTNQPRPGHVSDDCARYLGAIVLLTAEKNGKLNHLSERQRDTLTSESRSIMGLSAKAALTTSDIPLPVEYGSEVAELVPKYGHARQYATVYPLGTGTTKLPRLKTSPAFGFIAMSGTVTEKSPQIEFVDFIAQKAGGLIRVPSELDADSIVNLGQFIARYAARETAKWEDTVLFTADGTGSYNSLKGVTKEVVDQSKIVTMATTKTKISDATLLNFRNLRSQPDAATLAVAAYYLHPSMEQHLATFNASGDYPYNARGVNGATLDGFPIRWVDVLPPYSTTADPSKVFAVFGDLSFWYLGIRAGFAIDTSVDVFFATDEIAVRALERFTIGMMAIGAMGGLRTAAS